MSGLDKKSAWKNKGGDLSLHVPTGTYYVRKSFLRQKIPNLFKSTGETQLWKAKEVAPGIIKNHLDIHLKKVKTVGEVIQEFLRVETANASKRRVRTQENHRAFFAELDREWGHRSIFEVNEVTWTDWLSGFMARKSKRRTFNDYAIYMNMLLRYAHRRGFVDRVQKIPFSDRKKIAGRVLTQKEIQRLSEAMNEDGKDWFVLAYECGMRLREALFLTWDRVDLETKMITLGAENVKTGSKTGKGRSFMATEGAINRLRARKARMGDASPFVFPSKASKTKPQIENKTAWLAAKKRAGIVGKLRRHDIRHTAISHLLLIQKVNITLVSEYVGTSVRTLQRVYLHSTAEQTKSVAVLKIGS